MTPLEVQDIITGAAQFGIKAKLWEKSGKRRIYAQTSRKDISVYLDFDNTDSAAFRVFCNTQQHPNWVKQQVEEYRQLYIGLFYAYVLERYKETGPVPNGFGSDINDMINEARAFALAAANADDNEEQIP